MLEPTYLVKTERSPRCVNLFYKGSGLIDSKNIEYMVEDSDQLGVQVTFISDVSGIKQEVIDGFKLKIIEDYNAW